MFNMVHRLLQTANIHLKAAGHAREKDFAEKRWTRAYPEWP